MGKSDPSDSDRPDRPVLRGTHGDDPAGQQFLQTVAEGVRFQGGEQGVEGEAPALDGGLLRRPQTEKIPVVHPSGQPPGGGAQTLHVNAYGQVACGPRT